MTKSRVRFGAWAILTLLVVMPAQAQAQAARAEDMIALDSLRVRWTRAYEAADERAMVPLYHDDAVRMAYDAPAVVGADAILAEYRRAFAARQLVPQIVLTAHEVELAGDIAVERGSYHEVLRARQGDFSITEDGKYVSMMRRHADGSWKFVWSIFNRDAAPPRR